MRPVDIGVDAARILTRPGSGRVRAVFSRALYLDVPGGLMALCSTQVPRGPLHLRMTAARPAVLTGCPVLVGVGAPSSLAIDLAADRGMTLAGFARGGEVNVYTGGERVV